MYIEIPSNASARSHSMLAFLKECTVCYLSCHRMIQLDKLSDRQPLLYRYAELGSLCYVPNIQFVNINLVIATIRQFSATLLPTQAYFSG